MPFISLTVNIFSYFYVRANDGQPHEWGLYYVVQYQAKLKTKHGESDLLRFTTCLLIIFTFQVGNVRL